jgi:hypothetical protein
LRYIIIHELKISFYKKTDDFPKESLYLSDTSKDGSKKDDRDILRSLKNRDFIYLNTIYRVKMDSSCMPITFVDRPLVDRSILRRPIPYHPIYRRSMFDDEPLFKRPLENPEETPLKRNVPK